MKKKEMSLDRLLMIVKTAKVNLHNQTFPLKVQIQYMGIDKNGKDLFQINDNLGHWYALQGTARQVAESLDGFSPMGISY